MTDVPVYAAYLAHNCRFWAVPWPRRTARSQLRCEAQRLSPAEADAAQRADRRRRGSGGWCLAGQFAACLQVAQDGGHPAVEVFGVGYPELAEYAGDVTLNGLLRYR